MTQLIAERRDVDFVLHEQLRVENFSNEDKFSEFNKKTIDMIITEARTLAIKELLPAREPGDREGIRYEKGKVNVPEAFHKPYRLLAEGQWLAMTEDPKWGGQGMPNSVAIAANDYFNGANYPLMMYSGAVHGVGKLIELFGTEREKRLFLKKLFSGEWSCTIAITEAQAGSDIAALNTKAVENPDGSYSLTGNKIFISGGDQDLTENIIHPVLARIEGAPPGVRGISLFLVPKFRVNDDGTPGDFNNIVCTGVEKKMGLRGNATCSLSLGEKGTCRGILLGEKNKGLNQMFVMMNRLRFLVGLMGFCCASASYTYALDYARQRIQGKDIRSKEKNAPSVPIVQHPDVRRQLVTMKAYVEGMRSLLYYVAYCLDVVDSTDDMLEKKKKQDLVALLTPVAKGYVSDRAFEVCDIGLQIYGGYGYTKDFPVEQLLRDCRIIPIYEGTNGIQAIDLFRKKLGLNNGETLEEFFAEIQKISTQSKTMSELHELGNDLEEAVNGLRELSLHMQETGASSRPDYAFAFAHPFLMVFGDIVIAWMLLWRAVIAIDKMKGNIKKRDRAFYDGQIKSAEYFIKAKLPVTIGQMNAILISNGAAVDMADASLGS